MKNVELKWTKNKPDFPCVFVARFDDYYDVHRLENVQTSEGYYLAWLDNDGCEWDSYDSLEADEYLVLKRLPEEPR